jgi:TolB protein
MTMIRRMFFGMILLAAGSLAAPAQAQLRVDITEGHLNPMPIAVADFIGNNPAAQQVGRDVAGVIRANLDRSGLFRPVEPSAFIERITAMNIPPRFADWRVINAQALVVGEVLPQADNRIRVEFKLYDTFG